MLPKLYKYTTLGQIQSWEIIVVENGYYTREGINTISESEITYCTGKNKGKSNQTTDQQQAQLEAKAKWEKKIKSGYNEVLTKEKKFFQPMLAHERAKYEKLLFTVPTWVQPKLDGMRVYQDTYLYSRTGEKVVSCPHLEQAILKELDGELYNHSLKNDFNELMSLARKTKPTTSDLEKSRVLQLHTYDYPGLPNHVFSERHDLLTRLVQEYDFGGQIVLVPKYKVYTLEDIEKYHEQFLSEGYEGTMIRLDLGGYENKRSKQLLKYKNWQDAEWDIIDITEGTGNRAGCAATVTILINGTVLCYPTMTGTEEYMRAVWRDRAKIIGKKQATVKYFGYTEEGSLRFCTVKTIIDYIP
jgi:DNA ligase-1